jgi:hypothetical protein
MSPILKSSAVLAGVLALSACTTVPTGPSVMVLPGTGKSFDQFRADDMDCRQYAQYQMGGQTSESNSMDAGLRSAAVGTAVGALAGAAIGGSRGAGVGAGVGLLTGSAAGSNAANASGYATQRQYDYAYQQCMYAKGNHIPVSGRMSSPSYSQQPQNYGPGYGPSYAPAPNQPPPPPGYVYPR